MRLRTSLSATFVLLLATRLAFAVSPPMYRIHNVESLGGTASGNNDINQLGATAGIGTTGNFDIRGFIYWRGQITEIGTLGGPGSEAFGLNDLGMVTGVADLADQISSHAFLYWKGHMRDLGSLGGVYSEGMDVNDRGWVVGDSDLVGDETYHAVLWEKNVPKDLGTFGGETSWALSINLFGQITGRADLPEIAESGQPVAHAFIYSHGKMQDIDSPDSLYSEGYRINDLGNVTGTVFNAEEAEYHAMVYRKSAIIDIGTLGGQNSHGYGINNRGQITGRSTLTKDADVSDTLAFHAILYEGSTMYDLNDLIDDADPSKEHVTLVIGIAINDLGWIAANGIDDVTHQYHGYLLEPVRRSGKWFPPSGHRAFNAASRPTGFRQQTKQRFRRGAVHDNVAGRP